MSLFTGCGDGEDEPKPSGPTDFFTLTVDPSFGAPTVDYWVMASSRSGDWIDVQPYVSGQTITFNGVVPDGDSFMLHFLSIEPGTAYTSYLVTSISDFPVNGSWLLKTEPQTSDTKKLTLKVINLPSNSGESNEKVNVTASAGITSIGWAGSEGWMNIDASVNSSPSDIFVTIYDNGLPKYVSYEDVELPTTIDLNASTEGVAADRTFTLNFPENYYFYLQIDAYRQGETFGHLMAKYENAYGGSSVNAGYMQGYDQYRTAIDYAEGLKQFNFVSTGPSVPETYTFPSFDFTIAKENANDFQATSSLPLDGSVIRFGKNWSDKIMTWFVLQPGSGSTSLTFKSKGFPQQILDAYPDIPTIDELEWIFLSGYQFPEGGYASIIEEASKRGWGPPNLQSDNYIRFSEARQ